MFKENPTAFRVFAQKNNLVWPLIFGAGTACHQKSLRIIYLYKDLDTFIHLGIWTQLCLPPFRNSCKIVDDCFAWNLAVKWI